MFTIEKPNVQNRIRIHKKKKKTKQRNRRSEINERKTEISIRELTKLFL